MKYRIIILIIIIISMGQISLSYIANTSRMYARPHSRSHARTHARTHTRTHAHTHPPPSPTTVSRFDGSVCAQPWRSYAPFRRARCFIQITARAGDPIVPRFWVFFSYNKTLLGRIETRTRDRMYCQTIRTVRDISRYDRARIATCSLWTPTDRQT